MTLPNHLYRNPLDILINAESHSCKGCAHNSEWMAWGKRENICAIGRKKRNSKCYVETAGRVYCEGGK